jgi:hypothetical protein
LTRRSSLLLRAFGVLCTVLVLFFLCLLAIPALLWLSAREGWGIAVDKFLSLAQGARREWEK